MPQLWLPDNSPSTYSNLIEAAIPKVQLSEFPVAKANLTCTFCLLIEVWDFLPWNQFECATVLPHGLHLNVSASKFWVRFLYLMHFTEAQIQPWQIPLWDIHLAWSSHNSLQLLNEHKRSTKNDITPFLDDAPPLRILYYFDWFGQHMTFLQFRKISENRKNRE